MAWTLLRADSCTAEAQLHMDDELKQRLDAVAPVLQKQLAQVARTGHHVTMVGLSPPQRRTSSATWRFTSWTNRSRT